MPTELPPTPLALTIAFCRVGKTRSFCPQTVAAQYKFYSFGDAMLVR